MKKRKKLKRRILKKRGKWFSAAALKVAVASAQGRRHQAEGTLCQDAVLGFVGTNSASIVLADGAGSASHSRLGAQITVDTLTRVIRENFKRIVKSKEEKARKKIMIPLTKSLTAAAKRHQATLRDFACTLLFVATDGKTLLIGQLGDGRIGIRNADTGEWRSILDAFKGEFFNETVFITSENATDLLQLAIGPVNSIDACVIMSDGAEEGLYQRASHMFAPAVSRMLEWVQTYDRLTIETALKNNLKDAVRLKTTDDVSVGYLSFTPKTK
jgi:hypothetical protein